MAFFSVGKTRNGSGSRRGRHYFYAVAILLELVTYGTKCLSFPSQQHRVPDDRIGHPLFLLYCYRSPIDSTSRNKAMSMSSRRNKQAELRRRMAEARSKLSLLADESPDRDDSAVKLPRLLLVEAAMATSSAATSSERAEMPRGGILRKPKYSNTSSSITDDASTNAPAAALHESMTAAESNADRHNVGASATNNKRLGDLMADYGDSSSDDHEQVEDGREYYDASLSSSSAENGYASRETQINPPRSKTKNKTSTLFGETEVTVDDDTSSRSKKHHILEAKIFHVDATPSVQGGIGKSSEIISDEVWDEFNALLEEDDARNSDNISSMSEGATTVLADVDAPPTATSTKTVTKKRKKREPAPTIKKDMYDNDATINFEQASYEARLARLMLLKSKKARRKNNDAAACGDDGVVGALLLKSVNELYDPGLAFQEEGGEVDEDAQYVNDGRRDGRGGVSGGRSMVTSSKSGTYDVGSYSETSFSTITPAAVASTPSQTGSASLSAPRTMATILRDRRDEARKLSSRGGAGRDDGGKRESESALLDDEYGGDGQWF